MKRILTIFLIVTVMSGCSLYRVSSEDITTNYYPPKNTDQVQYIEQVMQAHEIIGIVNVNTERNKRLNEIIEKIKREAAILGGDAITDIKSDATGVWKKIPPQKLLGNAYIRANFSANVIVFK